MKYIDAEKLKAEVMKLRSECTISEADDYYEYAKSEIIDIIDSLQQTQQMPNSTQLIAEWEKEKEALEQKDFRGDAERMAYNAFLDGFVKGLGYEGTK